MFLVLAGFFYFGVRWLSRWLQIDPNAEHSEQDLVPGAAPAALEQLE